jgi:predicted metalloprotease with PDZ domain
LALRQLSKHQRSLDDVLRRLWVEFGQTGVGYTEDDYIRLVEEVAGRPMRQYFDSFIHGTAPLEEPLTKALNFVGCTLVQEENVSAAEGMFGFKTILKNERTEVTNILPHSPAAAVLTVDDEIIAVNGRRVQMNLQVLLNDGAPSYELSVFRHSRLLTVSLAPDPARRFWPKITIEKRPDATPEQQVSFRQWLKQDF